MEVRGDPNETIMPEFCLSLGCVHFNDRHRKGLKARHALSYQDTKINSWVGFPKVWFSSVVNQS